MSQSKPGKLRMNLNINVNAMKPGAIHPLIAKRRRSSETMFKKNRNKGHKSRDDYKDEYKQHPDDNNANVISAKLNQVTITKKRRKGKRKPKTFLLSNDKTTNDIEQKTNDFNIKSAPQFTNNFNGYIMINNQPHRNSTNTYVTPNMPPLSKTPPPPLPPLSSLSPSSLIPNKVTPFGTDHQKDIDAGTPQPPLMPTPPPPPPPSGNQAHNRRHSAFVDVKKAPPIPSATDLTNINKAPRDTAASTTFTVCGQKITIIGHARTGKTSLKNALFGRKFKEMTFPTVKAPPQPSIMVKPLKIGNDDDDDMFDINVQYEIWDTPGQKVLDYIPPLYITGSFCVFIVYDITDRYSYDRAKYWVNYLENNAKGYDNVVLIGNKYDLHITQRCIKSQEVQNYAQEHDLFFIEMSVKTKHNFDLLLSYLNHKTQDKFKKEIAMEKEECDEKGGGDIKQGNKMIQKKGNDNRNKHKRNEQKKLLKQHRRNNETIQLDKIDVHSRNKKGRVCCLW